MKQIAKIFFTAIVLTCILPALSHAANGNSNATGYWNNPSTWLFNGSPGVPNCGDTVNILSGYSVTINQQNDYTACGTPMIIHVFGTLNFTNGNKLSLPCGSAVYIHAGGVVQKITSGGGNSTLIEICGQILWSAADGPMSGPDTLQVSSLPITLLSFSADPAENKIDVSWITASEINNDYFTIEKSTDGTDFVAIATVNGAGNSSSTLNYSYSDHSPVHGISYYRLKQTDYDGQFSYSSTVMVNYSGEFSFDIVSAFAGENSTLNLLFTADRKDNCRVEICDVIGKHIFSVQTESLKGMNRKLFQVREFVSGIYFVTLSNGKQSMSRRFIR